MAKKSSGPKQRKRSDPVQGHNATRIRVRVQPRREVDLQRLAQAVIALAMQEANKELHAPETALLGVDATEEAA